MRVSLNGQPRFDFDSLLPIAGEQSRKPSILPAVIETMAVIDVILVGIWLCIWWYHGGWWMLWRLISHFLPWLLRLATVGQM